MGQELRIVESDRPSLSLDLPSDTPFEQWVSIGRRLCAGSQVVNWHIGDWWAFGDHAYGARAKLAAEGVFGSAFQTLQNMASVARSFETSRRREAVGWSHHVEVASLSPEVADAMLERTEVEGLSVRDLRRAVKARDGRQRDIIDVRSDQEDRITQEEMIVELAESLGALRALTDRESGFLFQAIERIESRNGKSPDTSPDGLRRSYRSQEVLAFIRLKIANDDRVPSYTEIQNALGFATRSDVRKVVIRLEQKGLLERSGEGRQRRIHLEP